MIDKIELEFTKEELEALLDKLDRYNISLDAYIVDLVQKDLKRDKFKIIRGDLNVNRIN